MGGSDDPSNIIELSIEDHAEAHHKLYEEHGYIEDYLAWKGLTGCIDKEEIIHAICVMNGKKRKGSKNPKLSELNKLKIGNLNPSKKPEVRLKLSIINSGSNNAMYGITGPSHPRYGSVGASTGKKWYHDPINSKETYCFENNQPRGYILGRLKRIKKGLNHE